MHRSIFIVFTLAVFMLLEVQGQWLDYLCQNKHDFEVKYNGSALVLLPADFKDHENSTWKYRKLCLYNEDEVGKCTQIGVIMNGTEYVNSSMSWNATKHREIPKTARTRRNTLRHFVPQMLRIRTASKRAAADLPSEYFYGESTCKVATNLKTAEVVCKILPSSIKCKSYCVYGTTFEEGIARMHSCTYKQNRWSKEFEECRPFVDCNLKLISPGNLKCFGNEIMKNPWCQVECDEYEDKAETNSQRYSCMANGKWQPPLPHCVVPKGVDLARAPAVKEHEAITYP